METYIWESQVKDLVGSGGHGSESILYNYIRFIFLA